MDLPSVMLGTEGYTPKLRWDTGSTADFCPMHERLNHPYIRLGPLITRLVLTGPQNWAGPGTAGPVTGLAGSRARADEAFLATLQRNVGSLRRQRAVCCERPPGSRDWALWSHKGAWKRMNALRFQLSLDSSISLNLFCKCEMAAAAKQEVTWQLNRNLCKWLC